MKKFLLISSLLLMAGCSYHQYDAKDPDKYVEFWCDPANQGLLDDVVRHNNKSKEPPKYDQPEHLTDIESKQRCIEKHQKSGDFDYKK